MPIVFVDGIDGAGKTTLINRLTQSLPPATVHVAKPLWHYLPAVAAPTDFARWVTNTAATEVAGALVDACNQRLAEISRLNDPAKVESHIFVDRGPRTVVASARAHLATGCSAGATAAPMPALEHLRATVAGNADPASWISVELQVTNHGAILNRLSDGDRSNSRYLRYLSAFLERFEDETSWPGVRQVVLDATADVEFNVRSVRGML